MNPGAGSASPTGQLSERAAILREVHDDTSYKCSSANYKTVFFAWPFEGLANLADRAEVMGTVIGWFGGCEVPPTFHVYLPLIL
jgi:hypothetical protein